MHFIRICLITLAASMIAGQASAQCVDPCVYCTDFNNGGDLGTGLVIVDYLMVDSGPGICDEPPMPICTTPCQACFFDWAAVVTWIQPFAHGEVAKLCAELVAPNGQAVDVPCSDPWPHVPGNPNRWVIGQSGELGCGFKATVYFKILVNQTYINVAYAYLDCGHCDGGPVD